MRSYVNGNDTGLHFPTGFVFLPGAGADCNVNGVPDACDIANGVSDDTNGNGVPDECETEGCTVDVITPPVDVTCTEQTGDVHLLWDEGANDYSGGLEILRDDSLVGLVSSGVEFFVDPSPPLGQHLYVIRGIDSVGCSSDSAPCQITVLGIPLLRGDCSGDGTFNGVLDAIFALEFQFSAGEEPVCLEACDADSDRVFNGLLDSIYILTHQFQGGPAPAQPYPECGIDPEPENSLRCEPNVCN